MDEDILQDIEFDDMMVPWDESWEAALDQPWYSDVWDWVSQNAGSLLSVGSGLYGMYQGREMQQMAERAFGLSDPFGSQRGQYQTQLSQLMGDPSKIFEEPAYKAALEQGQQAVERRMAAQGFLGSGNMAVELQDHAMGTANQFFNERVSQLAGLAGAGIGPNFGASLSGYGGGADLQSQGLASIGFGAGRILGGGASAGTPEAARQGFNSAGGEAAKLKGQIGLGKAALGAMGKLGDVLDWKGTGGIKAAGVGLGALGDALGIYSGIEKGDVKGYVSAAKSGVKLAQLGGLGGEGAAANLSMLGKGLGVVGALYGAKNTFDAIKSGNTKGGALSGASTGAAIGSIVPGIGTVLGAGVGALIGGLGAAIVGKDNPEEKVADAYYGQREKGGLQLGMTSDQAFTEALVGEFRRSRSSFPARLAGYGPKDDDKWAADLANKINSAYSSGTIGKSDDAFSIYQKVVSPWFQSQGGWRDGLAQSDIKNMETLALDTVHRYISGRPITWQEARGNKAEFAVPTYLGLGGGSTTTTTPKLWGTNALANIAMRPSGRWAIPTVSGRPY